MEPIKQLTYPISPDYVKSWTIDRAISELVANARDEDADFTYYYDKQAKQLIIEDNGPGIPEEGMILGLSNKTSQQIGTHGEGKKIASLVLARSKSVSDVYFETVGYAFRPVITKTSFLDGVKDSKGINSLAYNFYPSQRERGTKVTISCSEKIAEKVQQRFLFLTEPNYVSPQSGGRVIDNGQSGMLYIGGVFIQENKNYFFSYDFSLEDAKSLQNRDRTEISGWKLDQLVSNALNNVSDSTTLKLASMILNGSELSDAEQRIQWTTEQRRLLYENKDALLGHGKFMYLTRERFGGNQIENSLDLKDAGYTLLQCPDKSNYFAFESLMKILDVPSVDSLAKKDRSKETTTEWLRLSKLTPQQKHNLEEGVRVVRGLWGKEAIDTYGVYEKTYLQGVGDNTALGFYQPTGKGKIAIQRNVLNSFEETVSVLLHEAAHRLRHKSNGFDYQDRTRGFEKQLETMAKSAALELYRLNAIPEPKSIVEEIASPYMREKMRRKNDPLKKAARDYLRAQMKASGYKTIKQLSLASGISYSSTSSVMAANSNNIKAIRAVAEFIGIESELAIVLSFACKQEFVSRNKNGQISGYGHWREWAKAIKRGVNSSNPAFSTACKKLVKLIDDPEFNFSENREQHREIIHQLINKLKA